VVDACIARGGVRCTVQAVPAPAAAPNPNPNPADQLIRRPPKRQEFLQGHTDRISALALSKSGRLLASGQLTYLGFAADIIIWDLATRSLVHRLQLQKVKIQALAFSPDEVTLASLGGADDNSLVLWDVASGEPICGSPMNSDFVLRCAFFNNDPTKLVTAGNYSVRVWTYNRCGWVELCGVGCWVSSSVVAQ